MRGGRETVDAAQDDMRAFGLPEDAVEGLQGVETCFEVEPENWQTMQVWMWVQTQWRVGVNGRIGLDYTAVDVVMRRLNVRDEDGVIFTGLQVMEIAALSKLHEE